MLSNWGRDDGQGKPQTDQKPGKGRRRLRMTIHGFESLPHIPGNLSAMPNPRSECMQRKNLSDTPSWPLALHNQVKANTELWSV